MIETARSTLRGWRDADAAAHHVMCNDPRVAATLGMPPSLADSQAVVVRQNDLLATHGHCFWVIETREDGRFAGWCGIKPGKPPIEGEVEIGWSIRPDLWGQGLAREAAEAVLAWTWINTDHLSVAAITAVGNDRSEGLMKRLNMVRCVEEDFDHPDLSPGDPLRRHVLYRIARPHD